MNLWPFGKPALTGAQKLARKQLDEAHKYALLYRASAEENDAFAKMYQERAERLQKVVDAETTGSPEIRAELVAVQEVLGND